MLTNFKYYYDIKEWVRDFLTVYQTKNVTPYVHSFANHAPEFIKQYGNIAKFTQEGLEKLNDITTNTTNIVQTTGTRRPSGKCLRSVIVLKILNILAMQENRVQCMW